VKFRYSVYNVIDGIYTEPDGNNSDYYHYVKGDAQTTTLLGQNYELNASPLAINNWILDGGLVEPFEITDPIVSAQEVQVQGNLPENALGKSFNGATYLTVLGKHLMVAPYADGENVAGVTVLDITNGLDQAEDMDYAELTPTVTATAAATAVKVNGSELTITLVVDNEVYIFSIDLNLQYTRTVTPGHYGTICLPYGSSSYSGAEFYEVSWLQKSGETPVNLYLDQLEEGNQLVAGKPYIFRATSTELTVTYTGAAVDDPIPGANGLTGSFAAIPANDVLTGNYVVAQTKFWTATATAYAAENRAYIVASVVPTSEQAKLPGRRRVVLGTSGENAESGFEDIIAPEGKVIKVIENGQLIMIRDGEKYNVQGQKL
jgi:hypothetical protein